MGLIPKAHKVGEKTLKNMIELLQASKMSHDSKYFGNFLFFLLVCYRLRLETCVVGTWKVTTTWVNLRLPRADLQRPDPITNQYWWSTLSTGLTPHLYKAITCSCNHHISSHIHTDGFISTALKILKQVTCVLVPHQHSTISVKTNGKEWVGV